MLSFIYILNMKSRNSHPKSQREARMNKINQRNGLFVAILLLTSVTLQSQAAFVWGLASVLATAALMWSFIDGYQRSDELEKFVQLKAAAISFIVVMFISFMLAVMHEISGKSTTQDAILIYNAGLLLHLFILPSIAKRAYEK